MERNLQYIVDHVFLPPKLPRKDDSSWERCKDLTIAVLDALREFGSLQPLLEQPKWASMARMIQRLQDSTASESVMSPHKVDKMLLDLNQGGKIIVHS